MFINYFPKYSRQKQLFDHYRTKQIFIHFPPSHIRPLAFLHTKGTALPPYSPTPLTGRPVVQPCNTHSLLQAGLNSDGSHTRVSNAAERGIHYTANTYPWIYSTCMYIQYSICMKAFAHTVTNTYTHTP